MPSPASVQVTEVLKQRYFAIMPELSNNWTPEQHDKNRLSRSLAAFAIEEFGRLVPAQAAYNVCDGGNDNGIDALCYDDMNHVLYLVQAKIGAAPDLAGTLKFAKGVRDVVGRRFDQFNADFARLVPDIEDALNVGAKVVACSVYLEGSLGPHAIEAMNHLKTALNHVDESFGWEEAGADRCLSWLTAEHQVDEIDVKLRLREWGFSDGPPKVFYGLASLADLVSLSAQHGKQLFDKNIRHYLGGFPVNKSIADTARTEPSRFVCFNNGITIVCKSSSRPTAPSQHDAVFTMKSCSVVNGAQTIGAAIDASSAGALDDSTRVLVTIVETGTDPDLARAITRARNTQTAVRAVDFAALDANQERIRRELAVSGIVYHYRPSADAGVKGAITVERAARALAALHGDPALAVVAKAYPGALSDPNNQDYRRLFTSDLHGIALARRVAAFDFLDDVLVASERAETESSRRLFYRHSRFFLMSVLAKRNASILGAPHAELSGTDKEDLSRGILEIAEAAYVLTLAKLGTGHLATFRSLSSVLPLQEQLMAALAAPPAAIPIPAALNDGASQ